MGDSYVIPFGTTLADLQAGAKARTDIADTAWNAVIDSVAWEYSIRQSGAMGAEAYSDSAARHAHEFYKWTQNSTYETLANMDPGNVPNDQLGLYNALWEHYEYLTGAESNRAGVRASTTYGAMDPKNFQEKFTRKPGTNTHKFFDDYVNEWATKLAGEVNAILTRTSTSSPEATFDPNQNPYVHRAEDQAKLYKQAHAQARQAEDIHVSKMPDLPGRPSAAVADFKEQCFLLAHIFKFAEYKLNNVERAEIKRLPYQPMEGDSTPLNACLMAHGEPYAFMNKLTQYSTQSTLLNLQTHEISSLVPKIRLFKVFENDEGEEESQEFHFDSFPTSNSLDFIMTDRRKRGTGVGIKDFTFSYEGSNPFSVKKSIKASVELFAASFDELFRHRQDILGHDYRYVDLALKTGGKGLKNKLNATKGSIEYQNLENLNFRIKAVVGWQAPPTRTGVSATSFSRAINNSFVTLNLTPTIHKFDIQDDGSVKFVCQYLAYIESHFDSHMFNVFGTEKTLKRELERKLTMLTLNETCDAKQLKGVEEDFRKQVKEDIDNVASSVIQRMLDREVIRYVNIPFARLSDLNKRGPYSPFGKKFSSSKTDPKKTALAAVKNATESGKELSSSQKRAILDIGAFSMRPVRGRNNINYSCAFFYVSDLIDTVLEGISERLESADKALQEIESKASKSNLIDRGFVNIEKRQYLKQKNAFKKMRVLLGPIEIVNQTNPEESKFINMGDIPVSLKYFIEWLAKQTINKASVEYPLPRFLNQFFKDFINTFLNDDTCFEGKVRQRTTLSQAAITSYKKNPNDTSDTISSAITIARVALEAPHISRLDMDNMWKGISGNPDDPWPILNLSGVNHEPISDAGAKNEINYFTYYAGRTHPVEKQNGDFTQDKNMGVHHYAIGKDRGIVKNIRMTATEIPYLKELRFAKEGYDGLEQLREVYDVSIDSYANVNTFPGTYIYVDPRGWSPTTEHIKQKVLDALEKTNPTMWSALKEQDLTRFGIGGYYMIKRSEHSFGPGKANTTIQAQWTHQAGPDKEKPKTNKVGKKDTSKCAVGGHSSGATKAQPTGTEVLDSIVNLRQSAVDQYATSIGDPSGAADKSSTLLSIGKALIIATVKGLIL